MKSQELQEADGFEAFWKAYPLKRSKLDALKAWRKLTPPLETVLDAIEAQRTCRQWRDGYIPHPATWLRRGGWMDELTAADFYQARL